MIALCTRKSGAADQMHYLTRDHLGSVDSVTNASGGIEVRLSYGAFGQRRKEAGWTGNPTSGDWSEITDSTRRGFTFHEMLDNLNLTHMNGRVYDQVIGRFISADPFIPHPEITQSFNRYSYVRNNPLTFTDPSGFSEDDKKLTQLIDGAKRADGGRRTDNYHSASMSSWMRELDAMPSVEVRISQHSGVYEVSGGGHPRGPARPTGGPTPDRTGELTDACPSDLIACASDFSVAGRALLDLIVGQDGGAAWRSAISEPWVTVTGGSKLPQRLADGLLAVRLAIPSDASANGMHAWHAGSNAYLAQQLGLVGAPLIVLGGLFHESPLDWNSFMAEQEFQGTVNHALDSAADLIANFIPGPGEPDPAFGGTGPYRGNPLDAWGQYPRR